MRIPISRIIPDLEQPRKTFNEESIAELQSSLDGIGLIQPITLRPTEDGKYMIIVGERRYRAAQKRGDADIECIVQKDVDDKTAREMQLAENSQHEDIAPLELGKTFFEHRQKYGMNQRELSTIVGLGQRQIARYEAIYTNLRPEVSKLVSSGDLDARTAYEVSKITNPQRQEEIAQGFVKHDLGLHSAEKVVQLAEASPTRPIESIIAQVQYNTERDKANHRELLNEYKRQQIEPQPIPQGKYKTITIDPPWPIEKILRDVRPNQFDIDYPTMTIDEIMALPVEELADENGCHIYLWTTHKFLPTAFEVLGAWGVKYQCLLTWVKNVGFTPFSFMYSTEHCLFARIGDLDLLKMGKRLDFAAKVREHSRKPDEFYDLVREVSPEPRIDMFGREKHEGFAIWGNEPNKFKPTVKAEAK
jgi:ParB/RepB/Spo0J family partition protein